MSIEQVIIENWQLAHNALKVNNPTKALEHLYHITNYATEEWVSIPPIIWCLRIIACRQGERSNSERAGIELLEGHDNIAYKLTNLSIMFRKLAELELLLSENPLIILEETNLLAEARTAAQNAGYDFSFFYNGLKVREYYNLQHFEDFNRP